MKTDRKTTRLEAVIDSQQDRLLRVAWFRLGNRQEAEDAVQTAFLKLWERGFAVDDDRNVGLYLYRTVVNECNDRLRRRGQETVTLDEEAGMTPDTSPLPGDESVEAEYSRIRELLSGLDEGLRELIVCHIVDGISVAELSRQTGIPESTLKSRLARALTLLKQRFINSSTTDGQF